MLLNVQNCLVCVCVRKQHSYYFIFRIRFRYKIFTLDYNSLKDLLTNLKQKPNEQNPLMQSLLKWVQGCLLSFPRRRKNLIFYQTQLIYEATIPNFIRHAFFCVGKL
jgi:hypothetical protein